MAIIRCFCSGVGSDTTEIEALRVSSALENSMLRWVLSPSAIRAGSVSAAFTAARSTVRRSGGVPGGATRMRPSFSAVEWKSSKAAASSESLAASKMVGTSGKMRERARPMVASTRIWPVAT